MIEYRLANSKDMSQLAKVHKECFPNSITAVLFNSLRTKYLMGYLQNGCIALLAEDDHKTIGFCLANQGEDTLFYSTIRSNIGVFIANILIQLLKANNILWSKLWDKIRFMKIHAKKRGGDSYKKLMDHSDQDLPYGILLLRNLIEGKVLHRNYSAFMKNFSWNEALIGMD